MENKLGDNIGEHKEYLDKIESENEGEVRFVRT